MVAVEPCHWEQKKTQYIKIEKNPKVYNNMLLLRSAAGAPTQYQSKNTQKQISNFLVLSNFTDILFFVLNILSSIV